MNFFVVTLFGFFLAVQASPLVEPRATLDVWDPTIIFPNKLTEWHPGGKEIVTWYASVISSRQEVLITESPMI